EQPHEDRSMNRLSWPPCEVKQLRWRQRLRLLLCTLKSYALRKPPLTMAPNSLLQRDVVEYAKVSRVVLPALTRIKADKSKRRKVTFRTEGRAIWQTYSEELSPLTADLWIDNAHFHRAVYPTPYARLGVQIGQSSRRCLTQCPGRADFR